MTDAPPRRIAVVIAAVALIAAVGAAAVTKSASLALATRSPDTALKLDPGNSIALAQAALRDVQVAKTADGRRRAADMARAAIRDDPSNSAALGALGLATDAPGVAYRLFRLSEALSRRSLLTQLALIEQSVGRDDVEGALDHYDIALRTSSGSASILFPVLVEAATDKELLAPIADKLVARPSWGELYAQQLAQTGTDLGNITTLFTNMIAKGVVPAEVATNVLYQRLLEAQDYGHAWIFYAATHPRAKRDGIRNGDFLSDPVSPAPLDWTPSLDGPVTAEIRGGQAGGGQLSFVSSIGDGGTAARQLLLLPAGRHVVRGVGAEINIAGAAGPYLRLDCAATRVEIGRRSIGNGAFEFAFDVPQGCVAQWLSLMVKAPEASEPIEGAIRAMRVD